jgi:hypothetical protein
MLEVKVSWSDGCGELGYANRITVFVQVDERQMVARELTGASTRAARSGNNTPTASSSQGQGELAIARHVRTPVIPFNPRLHKTMGNLQAYSVKC